MPEITAYAKIFRDWKGLIESCIQHAVLVPGVESLRAELEAVLARARESKVLQEGLTASRLATTQHLQDMVADGRELARKIRYFVRVPLGSRSELLTAFGITPTRGSGRREGGVMKNRSYRDLLADWERLLAAVRSSEVELPVLLAYRLALETHYETVKAARARQLELQKNSQLATRDLRAHIHAGGDEASRLRSQLKAVLGPRDPRLRLYGIAPLPARKPREEPPCRPPAA